LPSTFNFGFSGPGLLSRTQWITIVPQDAHIAVRVEMTRLAVINGRVLDERGWGMPANVVLTQYYDDNGVRRPLPLKSVQSDDLGRYRFGNLPPGRYYLRVRPQSSDYLPTWYPSVTHEAEARPIDLAEGHDATLDIRLAPGGGVELRGQVIPPPGFQASQVNLQVTSEDIWGSSGSPAPKIAPDGTFKMRRVAPGPYSFIATTSVFSAQNAPPANMALQTVDVKSENTDGVMLVVGPTVLRDLKGAIVSEGAVTPEQVHITLERPGYGVRLAAQVAPDGSFVIPGVWPGRYYVRATASPQQVLSARFGGQEVLQRLFDFDGADSPLRVTLAGAPAKLTGTVVYANNQPVAGARVVFVRSGSTYGPDHLGYSGMPRFAGTDQNGAILWADVPPGIYRVYVIANPADADRLMENAEFVNSQNNFLPPVTVLAAGNPPLKLVLPSRSR
jgi:hypothetical protein